MSDFHRIIIAGSRDFLDYDLLKQTCDECLSRAKKPIEIVSGNARGADRLGEKYARDHGYALTLFPAQWNTYGKSAGYKRNVKMAEYADVLIAFSHNKSRGTAHMIQQASKYNLITRVVNV
jgi:hypothetical protein